MAESKTYKTVSFTLPMSSDPDEFGPDFWKAFEKLASEIPCEGCRPEAMSFVSFWHDLKNYDLGKPLYDKANFQKWVNKINNDVLYQQEVRKADRYRMLSLVLSFVSVLILVIAFVRRK